MSKMSFLPRSGGTRVFATDEEKVIDDIARAVPSVSESQYTVDGKPRVDALEQLLGEPITEAQRDKAFDAYRNPKAETVIPETSEDTALESTTGDDNETD